MEVSTQNHNLGFIRMVWRFRRSAIIIFTPMLLLPLPLLGGTQVANCIYMMCLMGIYWATEACPLAVTSLLPAVLCPLFGMQDANTTASNYINHSIFLVIGTLIMCISIEECGLHRRIALKALLWFGSDPCWVLLGLMTITAFLSMWLMNMSTLSLMLPITLAVCNEMDNMVRDEKRSGRDSPFIDAQNTLNTPEIYVDDQKYDDDFVQDCEERSEVKLHVRSGDSPKSCSKFQKPMLLGICYASSIGGISTAVGTPTNMIGIGIFQDRFNESSVNFVTWLGFCLPISIAGLLVTWLWILIRFLNIRDLARRKNMISTGGATVLRKLYSELPKMSFAERAVGVHFVILVVLWIFRDPKLFAGWSSLFATDYLKDSSTAVLVGLSIFLFPSKRSSFEWMWRRNLKEVYPSPSLLSWKTFQKKFPWDIMLLIGSGFAIAGACKESGLSESVGYALAGLRGSPTWLVILAISTLTSITTEFASNAAMVGVLLPILLSMSEEVAISPVAILLAVTLSGSFAFALPIATPCNALIYSTGAISIPDMLWTGIPLNVIFIALLNLLMSTSGPLIFNFEEHMNPIGGNVTEEILQNAARVQ